MNNVSQKIELVLFSGGRGTATMTEAFVKHPSVNLTILINAYDDGLSTGKLRKFIPGLLGPSDVRKNISRLIPANYPNQLALKFFLEYRMSTPMEYEEAITSIEEFIHYKCPHPEVAEWYSQLSLKQIQWISRYLDSFLSYVKIQAKEEGNYFDFSDCSFGNIIFAGCFLDNQKDFNKSIKLFSEHCEISSHVLNITKGENYILMGIKEDGSLLTTEAEIVSPQNPTGTSELFILEEYLSPSKLIELRGKTFKEKVEYLKKIEKFPEINPLAEKAIQKADVIVYGPGTQHSSLFPSYLTERLAEAISENKTAEKIFISNILRDHDIPHEDVNHLVQKFLYYINRKENITLNWENFITSFFVQKNEVQSEKVTQYIPFNKSDFKFSFEKVRWLDWEDNNGAHGGGQILDEILGIVQSKLQIKLSSFHYSVSIIVPALNEEKTVRSVLHELMLLDFSSYDLGKEIIFVDGGSTDRTLEYAKLETGVRIFKLEGVKGKGAALKLGMEKAKGNIIVFYPSDKEYSVNNIYSLISPIVKDEFQVVFGSRSIKCMNLNQRILDIYHGNRFNYFVSKYGGMALSILTLLLYKKYVSDALTSLKAFNIKALKILSLVSNGVDLEMELIAKVSKQGIYILEVPVDFSPRTKKEGKKINLFDGIKCFFALIRYRFFCSKLNLKEKTFEG